MGGTAAVLDFYAVDLQKNGLLTPEEEVALILAWRGNRNPKLLNRLVVSNLRYVARIVRQYRRFEFNDEDLLQEGTIGMIRGFEKFDTTRGIRLMTYCAWWIHALIRRHIIQQWSSVALSSQQQRLFFAMLKAQRAMTDLGEHPDRESLAAAVRCTPHDIEMLQARMTKDASLNTTVPNADDVTFEDLVIDGSPQSEELLSDAQEKKSAEIRIRRALWFLSNRERDVIRLRFLTPDTHPTFEAIGVMWGVSREYVRQVQRSAIQHLAEQLGSTADAGVITKLLRKYYPVVQKERRHGSKGGE